MKAKNNKIEFEYELIKNKDEENSEDRVFDFILELVWSNYRKTKLSNS